MCPLAHSDGHNFPRPVDEVVPGVTAMVDDIPIGREDPVREPVGADKLPGVLDRVTEVCC